MEINLRTKSTKNNNSIINPNKTKILYKFQIVEEKNSPHTHMGKNYFISLNSLVKKEEPKNKTKLPLLTTKEKHKKSKTIEFLDFMPKSTNYNQNNYDDQESTEQKLIAFSTKKIFNNKIYGTNGVILQTESPEFIIKNNHKNNYDEIVEKYNRKYFIKRSTVRYLTKLFFENSDNHDLKVVGIGKIKGKQEKQSNPKKEKRHKTNYYKKNDIRNRLFTQRLCTKIKSEEKAKKYIKTNKSNLDKLLQSYKENKINISKKLVNDALKDLYKIKEKNIKYFKNFKDLCDRELDDLNNKKI